MPAAEYLVCRSAEQLSSALSAGTVFSVVTSENGPAEFNRSQEITDWLNRTNLRAGSSFDSQSMPHAVLAILPAAGTTIPIAQIVAAHCSARGWSRREREGDLTTVLSEMLANSVLHGTLGLPSFRAGNESEFQEWINARLVDKDIANTPVLLFLRYRLSRLLIHVEDSGPGFVTQSILGKGIDSNVEPLRDQERPPNLVPKRDMGRGLMLVKAMTDGWRISASGTRVSAVFYRREVA